MVAGELVAVAQQIPMVTFTRSSVGTPQDMTINYQSNLWQYSTLSGCVNLIRRKKKDRQFLVMSRHEDNLHIGIYSEDVLKKELAGEWQGYDILQKVPDPEYFPSCSVFIFSDGIVTPKAVSKVTAWEIP